MLSKRFTGISGLSSMNKNLAETMYKWFQVHIALNIVLLLFQTNKYTKLELA